jgi:hypothetical protein
MDEYIRTGTMSEQALGRWATAYGMTTEGGQAALETLDDQATWDSLVAARLADTLAAKQRRITIATTDAARRRNSIRSRGLLAVTLADEMGKRWGDVVRQTAAERRLTVAELKRRIIGSGFSESDAATLAALIDAEYDRQLREYAVNTALNVLKPKPNATLDQRTKSAIQAAVKLARAGILTDDRVAQAYDEAYGVPHESEDVRARLRDMERAIREAPEGFPRRDAERALIAYVWRSTTTRGQWSKGVFQAYWYANMLSGYGTSIRNMVDTTGNLVGDIMAMQADPRNWKNAGMMLRGLMAGMRPGLLEAASKLKSGSATTKLTEKEHVDIMNALEMVDYDDASITEVQRRLLKLMKAWRLVGRLMEAEDLLMFKPAEYMHAYILAAEMLRKNPSLAVGANLMEKVANLLHNTDARRAEFEAQAKTEGYTGLALSRRVFDMMEQTWPNEIREQAHHGASLATYNYRSNTWLGQVGQWLNQLRQNPKIGPVARAIVPFTSIVVNVVDRKLDWGTPIGVLRAYKAHREAVKAERAGDTYEADIQVHRRDELIAKTVLGTLAFLALAAMTDNDDDPDNPDVVRLHASGPRDPAKRAQLRQTGWRPWTLEYRGKFYNFMLTPLAFPMAILAAYRDYWRYDPDAANMEKHDAVQTAMLYSMIHGFGSIASMSFLSSATPILAALQDAQSGDVKSATTGFARWISRTAASVTSPNLVRQAVRHFDPVIYTAYDRRPHVQFLEFIARDTPVARNWSKPRINALGETVTWDMSVLVGERKSDPVWNFLAGRKLWLPDVHRSTTVGGQMLSESEHYLFSLERGKTLRADLEQNLGALRKMNDDAARKWLERANRRARARASWAVWQYREQKQQHGGQQQ